MVSNQLGALLEDLGKILKIPDLHPDENNTCLLRFDNGVQVQLELDKVGSSLIIGSDLGVIPAGRYRENVLGEALKANGLPPPRYGIFAYSKKSDKLVLFQKMPLDDITADKIASFLPNFIDKAIIWKEAIAKGDVPAVSAQGVTKPSGMFGLR
jgi:hypothetical protein